MSETALRQALTSNNAALIRKEAEALHSQLIGSGLIFDAPMSTLETLAVAMAQLGLSLDSLLPLLISGSNDAIVRGLVLLCLLVKRETLKFNGCWERWHGKQQGEGPVEFVMGLRVAWELGGFHRVVQARQHAPHAAYLPLMDRLIEDIR